MTSTRPRFLFLFLSSFLPSFSFPLRPSSFLVSFFLRFFPSLSPQPPPLCVVFLTSVHFELVEQRLDLRHGAVHDGVEPRRRGQLRRRDLPWQHLQLRSVSRWTHHKTSIEMPQKHCWKRRIISFWDGPNVSTCG